MPEMRFRIRWPDGVQESCYSPSLVIKDYLQPGETYNLGEFLTRARTALNIASERVKARYGMPCSLALGQLARLESAASRLKAIPDPHVTVEGFDE